MFSKFHGKKRDYQKIESGVNDAEQQEPKALISYLYEPDERNQEIHPFTFNKDGEPDASQEDIQTTNSLIWLDDSFRSTFWSIMVNFAQFLVLLVTAVTASCGTFRLKVIPAEFNNIALIFCVIPILCAFLAVKLVAIFDPFLEKEIVIKQLIYTNSVQSTCVYILGLVVIKELFTSQTTLTSLALHRFVVLREIIITSVVVYATVNIVSTQTNPISAVVNFYGVLFVLDFDEYLYSLTYSQFRPFTRRREYLEGTSQAKAFKGELQEGLRRFEVAYTLQLFVVIYVCVLMKVLF
jgi:hypothetical protein